MRATDGGRTRRWFWSLTVLAVLATGALSRALTAEPGVATGLQVAGSGLLLAVAGALATRVLLATSGTARARRDGPRRSHGFLARSAVQLALHRVWAAGPLRRRLRG